ncbi:acylneuraminate cytidylyltransferase family protein [Macellibacteroides fermentans]|uniref:acylneuraminate cytidylyltransferase family protein n=1 Tax=Macellibacteroides fermentans TaxID=879969 RepID=UPI00406C8C85
MYNNKKILAIIPARGGSKGLPRKNIMPLLGKPLIGWTIEQAKACKYIDEVFVSTDNTEIAEIAEKFGVIVPSLRPEELASDTAPSIGFILYTIELYKSKGYNFDYIVLLEPTSPLRDTNDIDKAIELLDSNENAESIVGVSKTEAIHPAFLTRIYKGFLCPYQNEMKAIRRQDLEELYFFEGSIYCSRINAIIEKKSFYHDKTIPYIVPKWKSFEIDDYTDFKIIETLMSLKNNNEIR